jgi:hypothetical protein
MQKSKRLKTRSLMTTNVLFLNIFTCLIEQFKNDAVVVGIMLRTCKSMYQFVRPLLPRLRHEHRMKLLNYDYSCRFNIDVIDGREFYYMHRSTGRSSIQYRKLESPILTSVYVFGSLVAVTSFLWSYSIVSFSRGIVRKYDVPTRYRFSVDPSHDFGIAELENINYLRK